MMLSGQKMKSDQHVYCDGQDSAPMELTRCVHCGSVVEQYTIACETCLKHEYLSAGQSVEVEFPDGWQSGWTIDALIADSHKDCSGRSFKHRYNVRHTDGREIREIHPFCARAAHVPQ